MAFGAEFKFDARNLDAAKGTFTFKSEGIGYFKGKVTCLRVDG